ncbi:hypothetical protein SASPL_156821 [Salvia splendens]|uniref:Senescence regulator S40 n=1 Tax=Salvia splendens TaxID=180675 RepID=A0A8X8YVA4_SALSN|nr:uncharacterized protein LOC121790707 [Salvia splendens]KAG6383427.1 hypothetical protein SASPL_156821 [Salvia splendens]
MAEEFEESEVVFNANDEFAAADFKLSSRELFARSEKAKRKMIKTVPMSIPEKVSWLRYSDPDLEADCGGGEMVPPHVIVGRRVAGKVMAFSVCTGNGRTLKGRDLSQVRNSVLRLTGFLET